MLPAKHNLSVASLLNELLESIVTTGYSNQFDDRGRQFHDVLSLHTAVFGRYDCLEMLQSH